MAEVMALLGLESKNRYSNVGNYFLLTDDLFFKAIGISIGQILL